MEGGCHSQYLAFMKFLRRIVVLGHSHDLDATRMRLNFVLIYAHNYSSCAFQLHIIYVKNYSGLDFIKPENTKKILRMIGC